MSFMQSEIYEQPQAIQRLLDGEQTTIAAVAVALRKKQPDVILIVARGTSDHAATYAKYLFGLVNGTIVALAAASLTTLYGARLNLARAAVIGISQSGKSTDVVEVMQQASAAGALTIGITNDPTSPLAAAAQHPISLHAGEERALPATKTYTTSLTALALLSAHLAGDKELLTAVSGMPVAVQSVLQTADAVAAAAHTLRGAQRIASLARGLNYATALETALKLKETCYLGAEPYSTADFMHGPFAIIEPGFPALLFAAPGKAQPAMLDMARALAERQAASVVIARDVAVLTLAAMPVAIPVDVDERLSPIAYVVAGQLFALASAQARGLDPDAPRSLNKVTLTR